MSGLCKAGLAVVRPPGHHAEPHTPHGFCLFNNVGIAAQYAVTQLGVERVLILDWDVHHGNGIQHMFYSDNRVLYISLHRYDYAAFFPQSEDANYDMVGEGAGKGFNVNIPWNGRKMGDSEYLLGFNNIVLPIATEFQPQLVLISAGFDAAEGDPLGGYKVTPGMYGYMTHQLSSLAEGRVVVALEGGYNLATISECATQCAKALLGDPLPTLQVDSVKDSALQTVRDVMKEQSMFWSCLAVHSKVLPTELSGAVLNRGEAELDEIFQGLQINSGTSRSVVRSVLVKQSDAGEQGERKPILDIAPSRSDDCFDLINPRQRAEDIGVDSNGIAVTPCPCIQTTISAEQTHTEPSSSSPPLSK
jgi:histone deacetylase 6